MLEPPNRKAAKEFLEGLKQHLNRVIQPEDVNWWILGKKASAQKGKAVQYEGLFVTECVLWAVYSYLTKTLRSPDGACKSFLAESVEAKKRGWTSDSPRSANKFPFTKEFGVDSKDVAQAWWGDSDATSPSCPDWALRAPCPHRVVFEAKLYRDGGPDPRTELVNSVYQCFYYRAHPETEETKTHPAWRYDYACLFAYDVSEKHALVHAWNDLRKEVKDACWDSANIFVIVLPTRE
jgi:hypothetical protein